MESGPKYINYEEGVTYNTLAREAIKYKAKNENLSEEMRILYVALTRAKEKLIITGLEKDYKKSIDKKEDLLNTYKDTSEDNKINKNILQRYLTYLDWIELVYLNSKKELDDILSVNVYKKDVLMKDMFKEEVKEEIDLKEKLDEIELSDEAEIKEKLYWEYKYKMVNNILTKSSVTKLKNMKLDLNEEESREYNVPEFLKEQKEITAAQKGTLVHLVLQYLNEKIDYDKDKIEELLLSLEDKNIINEKERKAVDIDKILGFTKTNIWKEMQSAKEVQKEKPFYINIPAKEIYGEDIDEEILVQGIIDLYYVTEQDELVLVDYKTDRVQGEAELIQKYSTQLKIYKDALEKSLHRKVNRAYIYSTYLGEEIEIFNI